MIGPVHGRAYNRRIVFCVLVGIITAGLHLVVAVRIHAAESFWTTGAADYGLIARSIASGNGFTMDGETPTAFRPPLYPLFLASLLAVSDNAWSIVCAQSALAGITAGILGFLAIKAARREWAAIVVLVQYFAMPDIVFENIHQRETGLFSLLLACSALLFVQATESHSTLKNLGFGICTGFLCLTRPYAPAIVPVALAWLYLVVRNGHAPRQVLFQSTVFVTGSIFVLLPWGVWNAVNLGQFRVTSTTTGLNIWKGNNPATDDLYPSLDVDVMDELLDDKLPIGDGWWIDLSRVAKMTEVERDQLLSDLAWEYIVQHPGRFIGSGITKLYALWTPQSVPYGTGKVNWTSTGAQIVSFRPHGSRPLAYVFLYLMTIVGIWRLRSSPMSLYLIVWLLFCSAVHFVTFGETRFRWPINLLSLPVSAAGTVWLLRRGLLAVRVVSRRRNVVQRDRP